MPKIFFVGPSGGGKTTLVNLLREESKTIAGYVLVSEVARTLMSSKGYTRPDPSRPEQFLAFQRAVIEGQLDRERAAGDCNLISDRSALDAVVFIWFYLGETEGRRALQWPMVKASVPEYQKALVILVAPLATCETDGVRLALPKEGGEGFAKIFRLILTELKIPFLDLTCSDLKERLSVVRKALNGTLPLCWTCEGAPNLGHNIGPSPPDTNAAIPYFVISAADYQQSWESPQARELAGMAVNHDRLCAVRFEDDVRVVQRQAFVNGGFTVNGHLYSFLPVESTNFKDSKCYFLRGDRRDVEKMLQKDCHMRSQCKMPFDIAGQSQDAERVNFEHNVKRPCGDAIRCITVTPSDYKQSWDLAEHRGQISRFVRRHGTDRLVQMSFDGRVKPLDVSRMLKKGVCVNGHVYNFLGCSSSGLKERKCYLWRGTSTEVDEILKDSGNFHQLKTVSKMMARIGLLFSHVTLTSVEVANENLVRIEDIERRDKNFTDGCGGISYELAAKLYNAVGGPEDQFFRDGGSGDNVVPSVFQIRYQGIKGVVALDPNQTGSTLVYRPSMMKFQTEAHPYIGVDRPHTTGYQAAVWLPCK